MLPTCRVVVARVATPCAFSVPVPSEVIPLKKVTRPLPNGVEPASTVAVRVKLCPGVVELAEAVSAVVVGRGVTVKVKSCEGELS